MCVFFNVNEGDGASRGGGEGPEAAVRTEVSAAGACFRWYPWVTLMEMGAWDRIPAPVALFQRGREVAAKAKGERQ